MSKSFRRAGGGTSDERRQEMSELVLDPESSGLSQRAYSQVMDIAPSTLATLGCKLGRVGRGSVQATLTNEESAVVELRRLDDLGIPTPVEMQGITEVIEVSLCLGATGRSWFESVVRMRNRRPAFAQIASSHMMRATRLFLHHLPDRASAA